MKAQKETKWVCIQLACSRRPRAFEEAHRWNIQAKLYNEKYPLVYESTLYHEDHGATLKHKCGKRIVTLSLLSFLSFFGGLLWPIFLWASLASFIFCKVRSLILTCRGIIVSIILSSPRQCSNL